MKSRLEWLRREQRRGLRFQLFGSVACCTIAYPLLIVAKLAGNLPDHGWWLIALWPLVAYSALLAPSWFACRLDLRREALRQRKDASSLASGNQGIANAHPATPGIWDPELDGNR